MQAADWLARQGRADFSAEDFSELQTWLKSSERHREAYRSMEAMWDDMAVLQDLKDISDSVEPEEPPIAVSLARKAGWGIAATVLLTLSVWLGMMMSGSGDPNNSQDFLTAVGEQRTVQLADGSTILMNTDTALSVAINDSSRRIRLVKGEAFFDVAHDPSRPFSVNSNAGVVTALGTSFATRLRDRSTLEVTVSEGRIGLSAVEISTAIDGLDGDVGPVMEVDAGNTAIYSASTPIVTQATSVEINRKLSWRDGVLVFAGEPLREVVEDVTRYTEFEIIIADSTIENLPVGGYFRVGEVEALFESLNLTFGIRVEREGDGKVTLWQKSS